ncbi:hypothetical protein F5884DRAFT_788581 [Xylogone sp. PMI_703]|nr:hypothetical protein F5884DRAFT_788581 [Xylogone sp. PMI_703]
MEAPYRSRVCETYPSIPTVKPILRRSHNKSKTGCHACKRRRVKCDEFRPTCRRCRGLGLSCIFPENDDEKSVETTASVRWPGTVEQACTKWKESGEPPFPALRMAASPSWHNMSMTDLRYLYQMAVVATMLELSGTSNMGLSWGEFPILFKLATNFDFVAYALAAMSAERLTLLGKSYEASRDASRYRNLAFRGLSQAIQSFSRDNADAILGASLACSYQMPNGHSLMTIGEGISKVAFRMRSWSKESAFHRLFEYDLRYNHKEANIVFSENRVILAVKLLAQSVSSLNRLVFCLQKDKNLAVMSRQLRDVARLVREQLHMEISTRDQYRLIHPFTAWFTKYSTASYIDLSKRDPLLLFFLSHMYAVVVMLAVALPAIDLPFFASIRLRGILDIRLVLEREQGILCMACNVFHNYNELMAFPLNTVDVYQSLWQGNLHFVV